MTALLAQGGPRTQGRLVPLVTGPRPARCCTDRLSRQPISSQTGDQLSLTVVSFTLAVVDPPA